MKCTAYETYASLNYNCIGSSSEYDGHAESLLLGEMVLDYVEDNPTTAYTEIEGDDQFNIPINRTLVKKGRFQTLISLENLAERQYYLLPIRRR